VEFPQFVQLETRFFEDAERDLSILCQPLGPGGADVEHELSLTDDQANPDEVWSTRWV
jgi:hypothetical protein